MTPPNPATGAAAPGAASATWISTVPRCRPARSTGSGHWPSRRPGPTSGSAPTRPGTSRRSAPTRLAAGSTVTTTTAKDFRTWHATVYAAQALADLDRPASRTAQRRVVAQVMREVAAELGNTPTVARASYVDPRVVERYQDGETVPGRARSDEGRERETRELLS